MDVSSLGSDDASNTEEADKEMAPGDGRDLSMDEPEKLCTSRWTHEVRYAQYVRYVQYVLYVEYEQYVQYLRYALYNMYRLPNM